jgi:hypothetical protein
VSSKASKALTALKPCVEIREAQTEARRAEAADARRAADRAAQELATRDAELHAAIAALSATARGTAFGVQELMGWQSAVNDAARKRIETHEESQRSGQLLADARDQLMAAQGAARQVKRNFSVARRKVARAADERQLRATEEVQRRGKRTRA